MRLELQLRGFAAGAQAIRSVADASRALAAAERSLATANARLVTASGGSGGGGASTGGKSPKTAARLPMGPFTRLQKARANLGAAIVSGDQDLIKDANLALKRAEDAVKKLQPKQPGSPWEKAGKTFKNAVFSTRFTVPGTNIHPLVGRTAQAAGSLMEALNFAPEVKAAVEVGVAALMLNTAALSGFATAVKAASESLGALKGAATVSGGTNRQVGVLSALGLSPAEIPGLAAGLRERIASDPFAASAANGMGIGYRAPGIFGPQNQAADLLKALTALRAMGEGEEQLRRARALGLENLLPMANVSERVWGRLARNGEMAGRLAQNGGGQAAKDLQGAWGGLAGAWKNVVAAFGQSGFAPIERGLNAITDALNRAAVFFAAHPEIGDALGRVIEDGLKLASRVIDLITKFIGKIVGIAEWGVPGAAQAAQREADLNGRHDTAMDRHTAAMEEHARAMRQGMSGGGERARGAYQPRWTGPYLEQNWQAAQWRTGAFGI